MIPRVRLPWDKWTPGQLKLAKFSPPPSEGVVSRQAMLGGWGWGKTTGAIRKFILKCLENGWTSDYGNMEPTAYLLAPTYGIMETTTLPKFDRECPPELILKDRRRNPKSPHIQLVNGVKVLLKSADGAFDGFDAFAGLMDEVSHRLYWADESRFANYIGRLRDPFAKSWTLLAAGLPTHGPVRKHFDPDPGDPNHITIRGGPRDNPYNPPGYAESLLASVPAGQEGMYIKGSWGLPPGATFPMFDEAVNVVPDLGDPRRPVHLGIDIGNHGSVLVAQNIQWPGIDITGRPIQQKALLLVDELLTEYVSVRDALTRLKIETPWVVDKNHSAICVDPTIRRDEKVAIHEHYPGVHVRVRERRDDFYDVDNSIRHLQTCIRDGLGNTRFLVSGKLAGKKFGLIDSIEQAKGNPLTGKLYVKDDRHDHVICAARYLVSEELHPIKRLERVG